jgi:hypothetical protein
MAKISCEQVLARSLEQPGGASRPSGRVIQLKSVFSGCDIN